MSDSFPGGSAQPEYLGPGGPGPEGPEDEQKGSRSGRRTTIVAAASLAVVAALGVGAYGVVQLLAGGSSPATAVPAGALGYVSLDLDPSASQKVEAFKMLRKFPSIQKELKLSSGDDLRKKVFEQLVKENEGCKDLDYAKDVEPWIGDRVAMAAMPDAKKTAVPLMALQVTDQAKAKTGFKKLLTCGDDEPQVTGQEKEPTGVSFSGDYLLVADTQALADGFAKSADEASLADDSDFKAAMDRAGDPGIVTMYASKAGADAIVDEMAKQGEGSSDQLKKQVAKFEGVAGVVRFADGGVEAEFTAKGLPDNVGLDGKGPDVTTLPSTTAALASFTLQDGWMDKFEKGFASSFGPSYDDMLAQAEQATGLDLPGDIETLLGDGVSVTVDKSIDVKALTQSPDPSTVPAGIRITGDPDKITPIIDKLKQSAGPDADLVQVATGDGQVAVGLNKEYVDSLLKDGGLGDDKTFQSVVPEGKKSKSVFYVNFDATDQILDQLVQGSADGAEVEKNYKPLKAFGVSAWLDGDVAHGLVRLSTD